MGERVVHLGGYGYSIERRQLLDVLQARARQLGVQMRFEETVDDAADIDADVVVAADGHMSALRSRRAEVFGTSIKTGANAYIWLGTSKEFKDFTFGCEPTDAGWLWYHGYQFARDASTVIVECADATWRGLGLDALDDSAGLEMLADVFRRHLDGAPLLNRRPGQHPARWSHFPTLTNERWYDGRVVLLGDAAHTAHYSIGSGTRLALEDAISLGNALSAPGLDLAGALRRYADERRPEVARWQAEAAASASWFESMDEHLTHGSMDVAHALLRRRHPGAAAFGDIDRSAWDYRLLHATQNPALRQARWLVGAARRRRAAARLR
jgi:anthraniloyl-CoA monooxygenase